MQDYELTVELEAILAEETLLPGFECLTWADLDRAALPPCPDWCVHTDEHDTDTDTEPEPDASEHRGVQHTIRIANGGGSFGYEGGNAAVSVQLEQDRDQDGAPVIVLEQEVNGLEHHAYLTSQEALELRDTLTRLLNDADRR